MNWITPPIVYMGLFLCALVVVFIYGYYVGCYRTKRRLEKDLLADIERIALEECRRIVRGTKEGQEAVEVVALEEFEKRGRGRIDK